MHRTLCYCPFLKNWGWGNRISKVAKETMVFYFMKVNDIMLSAANIHGMLMIVDFLFHQGKEEDQQRKDA